MKTLNEIENEVLTELKWADWKELLHDNSVTERKVIVIREIVKRYAEQAIDQTWQCVSELELRWMPKQDVLNAILNVKQELK